MNNSALLKLRDAQLALDRQIIVIDDQIKAAQQTQAQLVDAKIALTKVLENFKIDDVEYTDDLHQRDRG
jgi:predicted YcjX-like family ATPase